MKSLFRQLLLCMTLLLGTLIGTPMRPEQIEELMQTLNQPKVAQTLRAENDHDDEVDEADHCDTER